MRFKAEAGTVTKFPDVEHMTNEELLELDVVVQFPSALEM